MVFEYLLRYW